MGAHLLYPLPRSAPEDLAQVLNDEYFLVKQLDNLVIVDESCFLSLRSYHRYPFSHFSNTIGIS